jgi:hypothetical protein
MTNKTYLVAGASWIAEVELEDVENFDVETIKTEAATRAIEGLFKKRFDIPINHHEPIEPDGNELHDALISLLTTELEEGCGVGSLICIMEPANVEEHAEHQEWYISSKEILMNVGLPHLVEIFDQKRLIKN